MVPCLGGSHVRELVDGTAMVPSNLLYINTLSWTKSVPERGGPSTHGTAVCFLHCTRDGRFKQAAPTACYDNTCIIESAETNIRLIFSQQYEALDAVARTERELNSSGTVLRSGSRRLEDYERQLPTKLLKIARDDGLTVAFLWCDAYAQVYPNRLFVTKRELYLDWLGRMAVFLKTAVRRPFLK